MKRIHKVTVALLSVVAVSIWNTTFATSSTIDVQGTVSESHSEAILVGTLTKINAGSLALSGTNATGNLNIQGGLVSVSAASNLNGASSVVTFAASGNDPLTTFANTATLEIAGTMNTGTLTFSTDGTVQVDSSYEATLDHAPTGTGLLHKTGAGVMKVASDLSASNTLQGIHVDAGTLDIHAGKAPAVPIEVGSGAILELGVGLGVGAIGNTVTVLQGGLMKVTDGGQVPAHTATGLVTYTFDFTTGYYRDQSNNALAKPRNLKAWNPTSLEWSSNDTVYAGHFTYGDISATGSLSNGTFSSNYLYRRKDSWGLVYYYFAAGTTSIPDYTTSATVTTDIFSSTINFAQGSKLELGAGSTWARNISVGTAS